MNVKALVFTLLLLLPRLEAEPALQIHNGTAWREIDAAIWSRLARAEVVAKAQDGKEHRYSGVPLSELVNLLAAPSGVSLRGEHLNLVVLFIGKDGYQVAFSLAELDADIRKQNVILADQMDGQALPEDQGTRMVVVPEDLKQSRWIRQVEKIALVKAQEPKP